VRGSNYRLDGRLTNGSLAVGADAAINKMSRQSLDPRVVAWGSDSGSGQLVYYPVGFNQRYESKIVRLTIRADSDVARLQLDITPRAAGATNKTTMQFPNSVKPGQLGEFALDNMVAGQVYEVKITVVFSSGFLIERPVLVAP
jgi:hypothetical protein